MKFFHINTLPVFFLLSFLLFNFFMLVSTAHCINQPLKIETYNFYEVHVWPDSRCSICHKSSEPDTNSASLVLEDQSRLCESCHENRVEILSTSRLKTKIESMSNHLIKFSPLDFNPDRMNHNIIKEGNSFFVLKEPLGKIPLYGDTKETAIVECSTCHDGHGRESFPNLNILDNSEAQICRICHLNYF